MAGVLGSITRAQWAAMQNARRRKARTGGGAPGPAYDPDAEALFARMEEPPSDEWKLKISNFYKAIKEGGVYPALDALHVYYMHDDQAAYLNLIGEAAYTAQPMNSPNFEPFAGVNVTSSSYLDFGAAYGAVGDMSLNDNHIGAWVSRAINSSFPLGRPSAAGRFSLSPSASVLQVRNGTSDAINMGATAAGEGHYVATRRASGLVETYRNGVSLGVFSTPSVEMGSGNAVALRSNTSYSPSTMILRADHWGSQLSAEQVGVLHAALQDLMGIYSSVLDPARVAATGPTFSGLTLDAQRAWAIDQIWSGTGFPTSGADSTATSVTNPISASAPANLLRVDRLTINMTDNVSSSTVMTNMPHVFRPTVETANGKLAVHVMGHSGQVNGHGYDDLTYALLEDGYTVVLAAMPDGGTSAHNALPPPTFTLNPLKFFIEPTIRAINHLIGEGFTDVLMCGLSGGGWTSVVCAAIDPRISASVSIAGSFPLYMTNIGPGARDQEQFLPGLWTNVSYEDLYVLSVTEGRKQVLVYNDEDDCCFYLSRYQAYDPFETEVGAAAIAAGGDWSMVWLNHDTHAIYPDAIAIVLGALEVA